MIKWLTVALIITWMFLRQNSHFLSRYNVMMNAYDWLFENLLLLFFCVTVYCWCGLSSDASNILTAFINYVHMVSVLKRDRECSFLFFHLLISLMCVCVYVDVDLACKLWDDCVCYMSAFVFFDLTTVRKIR